MLITRSQSIGRRRTQEDHLVLTYESSSNAYVMAAIDGHGGDECADLVETLVAKFSLASSLEDLMSIRDVLNQWVLSLHESTKHLASGCALTLAIIHNKHCYAAVLGDCSIAWLKKDSWSLGPTHNFSESPEEVLAALSRSDKSFEYGPYVCIGEEGLAMGRSLGDLKFNEMLSREPDIVDFSLSDVTHIVLCTDGALDAPKSYRGEEILKSWSTLLSSGSVRAGDLVSCRNKISPLSDNCSVLLVSL